MGFLLISDTCRWWTDWWIPREGQCTPVCFLPYKKADESSLSCHIMPPSNPLEKRKQREMVCCLNFTSTEMAVEYHPRPLPEDHLVLCPSFDLRMATWYAQDSNIPEMVQATFYAMAMNMVAERGIMCRILAKLMGARSLCPMNPPANLASSSGPVEASGLSDATPVSTDKE
ncbi:hypothetical protein Cgig2_028601 [Carnegiea gigantea]|uniref:Uncharacterized protein n=1 Tax=Carnegiea gigantea TaxID=171969 RepID=A0A9Q1K6H5_9CARY|nr:hypothetical protein Cgig2_028601 [Carnegiea gigantea]